MSKKTGRNDPCPCGSGKKHKNCCQPSANEREFRYQHWRRVEHDLIPKLIGHALERVGDKGIEDAWSEFYDDLPEGEHDPESPMNIVFMPWFLFNWQFKTKRGASRQASLTTIGASFLSDRSPSPDEAKLIISVTQTPYSLCEVKALNQGVGMTLFDLIRRIEYEVLERTATQTLSRGDIIYCGTTDLDGIKSNIGTGPYALRPIVKRDVLELRKWMMNESGAEELTEDHLLDFDADIRAFYLGAVDAMFRPPKLVNTDKDPLLPQKVHFDIESADAAFRALIDLSAGIPEDELLADATLEEGLVIRAEIPWQGGTKEARKRLGGPVLLGTINLEKGKLTVAVNSTRRAEGIRALIEKRLGNAATYKATVIEPIESDIEKAWALVHGGSSEKAAPEWTPPELRSKLEEIARQHSIRWIDEPVPALNNLTPREATETEEGRDLLESLLLYFESQNRQSGEDYLTGPDIAALRRELGMEDKPSQRPKTRKKKSSNERA